MITKANILAAAASIVMGPGGGVNFEAGCTITRTGTGTYDVLVDETQTVPPSVGFLTATTDQPTIGGLVGPVVHVSDTAGSGAQTLFTLTTFASDVPGDLTGNLGVEVIAVGGGNSQNPSQTGI